MLMAIRELVVPEFPALVLGPVAPPSCNVQSRPGDVLQLAACSY
jgi:hypothetical protein